MSELIGACLIGQSGGPTAVINSSAYGVIKTALGKKCITKVLAAQHGIRGILDDSIIDMGKEDAETLELMLTTPASLIRSCRYKLKDFREDDTDYKRILEIFKKYNIRYFFYNGGNDSMDTCNKISEYMATQDYECRIIGVPKTIDNDLVGTDHCPGFGSSAKYIALSVAEVIKDVHVYDRDAIVVIEVMGRHAGWLAGAAALSKICCEGPAFVYLPEVPFDMDQFFEDLDEFHKHHKRIVLVFSEGIKDKHGKFISEYGINDLNIIDEFGHSQLGGLAATMSNIIRAKTGSKVRGIELSLLQRCASHAASKTDRDEAAMAGAFAVEAAVSGETGKMVGFRRDTKYGIYKCTPILVDLKDVANAEKVVPREWINEEGNNVTDEFIEYVVPLIQGELETPYEHGMPKYARLKRIPAETVNE